MDDLRENEHHLHHQIGPSDDRGGRGDLIAEARIVLPTVVDERGKELIREIGKLYVKDAG